MKCKLCQNQNSLKESHIIPKFVSKWLKDTSATGFFRQVTQPNLRRQDFATEKLLCGDCENLFSRWENLFAKNIFRPFLNDRKCEFDYDIWLLKFVVSILWRLGISDIKKFENYKPHLVNSLEQALSVWRDFLLTDRPITDLYGFHIFFLDFIANIQNMSLPKAFFWYTLRGVDATLPASETEVYSYVKFPGIFLISGILPPFPSGFINTQIFHKGKLNASNQIMNNPNFSEFFLDRIYLSGQLMNNISENQIQVISKSIQNNPDRSLNSHTIMVYLEEQFWKNKGKLD